ncbi:M56 family metallopeptidase [Tahibacter caeni]|uniref:M56 family metallopeptidase n=1 Tax=Tahibacter caeni TaxID=1453545 RepID=UPI00214870AC|nr:M56 family metallopeptidase [Tahibacter caeni]
MDAAVGGLASGVHLLGLVLLHFLWQGALIGAAYGLLRRHLAAGTPRYTLGLVGFALLTVAPIVTAFVLYADAAATEPFAALTAAPAAAAATFAAEPQGLLQQWTDYLPWLVALWGCGVVVLSLRALLHWQGLNRLIREGSPLPEWSGRLAGLCARFGLGKVGLLYSTKIETPTLVGWIRPVILLPAAVALRFPAAQIELILAHELGHLRRWDHLVNLAQVVVETVLFYHPVVHWISRDLRDQREICCDELVLRMSQANPRDYVATLADLEQLRLDGPGALALQATGGVLLERVQHIAKLPTTRLDLRAPVRLLPLFVVGLAVIVLGYAQRSAWENANMLALLAPQPLRELLLRDQAGITAAPIAVADMIGDRRGVRLPRLPILAEPAVVEPVAPALTAAPPAALPITQTAPPSEAPAVASLVETAPVKPLPAAVPAPSPASDATPAAPQTLDTVVAIREPMAAHAVQPLYPERALLRGIEGSVRLSYYVDEDGRVRDVRVEQSNPPTVFDSAALSALRKWRFVPGSFEAGSRRYSRLFVFALEGGAPLPAGSAIEEATTLEAGDCRTITGSRICRRAGDSASPVTEIPALN